MASTSAVSATPSTTSPQPEHHQGNHTQQHEHGGDGSIRHDNMGGSGRADREPHDDGHPRHSSRSGRHARQGSTRGKKPRRWAGFSPEQLQTRRESIPEITYPDQLPVSARKDEIAAALMNSQVVIVAGETGSGKTTQLPKICLELGRGITGMIGHTQPRRIAARSVAERIAHELGTKVGPESTIGYQVRFTEETGPNTLVKLMTDGILLAELQNDPLLSRYDTIIVDEAHERSLNIDFLLGYLAQLLPQRPDLKVIITSATIDSERFAEHFAIDGRPAPIIEVSGRTYPVEIRYRPLLADDGFEERDHNRHAGAHIPLSDDELSPSSAGRRPAPARAAASSEDKDQVTGILEAVDELMAAGPGDILVFLAGERDIRDTEQALIDHLGPRYAPDGRARTPCGVEILPLFSRLSAAEQHRIFEPHSLRRIVLATNVAETSLTVPGIRYVIDPGLARISRYSNRTKVQRLPIEPISQASANQRAGRCGRVADGIAIRLYSEADFKSRPEYTEPEILRTSLASVILQMAHLGLGSVENFPFLEAPDHRAIRDGLNLLTEIGAIEPERASKEGPRLTAVGRRLARLPIDPRLGRMLLRAGELGCVGEVMVIVAALSIQDVRDRPLDAQESADALHRRFADPTSDFLTYLNLWRYIKTQSRELSSSAFRRMCRAEHLHYLRVREWQDVHTQLRQLARPLGLDAAPIDLPTPRAIRAAREALEPGSHAAQIANGDVAAAVVALGKSADTPDADAIHRSLLVGLLSNVGTWDERRREYAGARGTRFVIWPGSGLRRKHYDWVMTAELVETSQLFARTVAKVDPRWIEETAEAAGLLRHVFSEPYWSTKRGAAMVHEKVMLYGMTLAADRPATLASVGTESARDAARDMFLRSGLVEGGWHARHGFVSRNARLVEELSEVEHRRRQHGLLASDEALFRFYDDRLPETIYGANDFDAWWRKARRHDPHLLDFTRELLLPEDPGIGAYPDTWVQGDLTLPLRYVLEPGRSDDGVSVLIPLEVLGRVSPDGFSWLVPGMRPELVVATIRALPKRVRRQLVPAPDVGAQLWAAMQSDGEPHAGRAATGDAMAESEDARSYQEAFIEAVQRLRGVEITEVDWAEAQENLPEYLRMRFVAIDEHGQPVRSSRDLVALQQGLSQQTEEAVRTAVAQAFAEAQARGDRKSQGKKTKRSQKGRSGRAGQGTVSAGDAGAVGAKTVTEQQDLTAWPMDEIPANVEISGTAGMVVRGYPALVRRTTKRNERNLAVDLRILPDADAQQREHVEGVLALAVAATPLSTGRVSSRWSPQEMLLLAASPYRSTDALVEDLKLAASRVIAERWASQTATPIAALRSRTQFEELLAVLRQELEDEVFRLAQLTAHIIKASREVEKAVEENTSLALLATLQQVREHAASLVYPGFVAATPPLWLQYLPRYLAADAQRVERAQSSPSQDAALAYQVSQAEAAVEKARAAAIAAGKADDATTRETLLVAHWMIEELRVSLFAQSLGTSRKVSLPRITKLLATISTT